ncbi:putative histidinol-phosphatase [Leucoagaricus sp. SymC.cos]|nr:putative histidinol-phosphatase [Leucoagaricus sp. SymC.cos]
MPHSHHSHSGQFCKHAVGTLEDVVKQAIAQRFEVFGLTEHVPRYREADLYLEEQGLSLNALYQQFISFLQEAQRLKVQYATQISLLVGLETEFITPRDLVGLSEILTEQQSSIDYIVGSIHHVNGIPIDFDEPTYQQALASFSQDGDGEGDSRDNPLEKFLLAYFDAQYELLQRFKPELVGHIDLCRLYTPDLKFMDYPQVWKRIELNVKFAVSYGALFEINAAAFRKKQVVVYFQYPSSLATNFFFQLILKNGGRFALSDDSHGPHAVGLNYDRAYEYLKLLNVTELWYLEPSTEPNYAGRKVRAVKLENWSSHLFWTSVLAGRR